MTLKLTIEINGKQIELTSDEARELYGILEKLVAEKVYEYRQIPYYPLIPWVVPQWPVYQWSGPTSVGCLTSGSSGG